MCFVWGVEIVVSRHDRFITRNIKTHLSTVLCGLTYYEVEFIADWKTVIYVKYMYILVTSVLIQNRKHSRLLLQGAHNKRQKPLFFTVLLCSLLVSVWSERVEDIFYTGVSLNKSENKILKLVNFTFLKTKSTKICFQISLLYICTLNNKEIQYKRRW